MQSLKFTHFIVAAQLKFKKYFSVPFLKVILQFIDNLTRFLDTFQLLGSLDTTFCRLVFVFGEVIKEFPSRSIRVVTAIE